MKMFKHAANTLIYFILKAPIIEEAYDLMTTMGEEIDGFLQTITDTMCLDEYKFVEQMVLEEMREGTYTGYKNYLEDFRDFLEEIGYEGGEFLKIVEGAYHQAKGEMTNA